MYLLAVKKMLYAGFVALCITARIYAAPADEAVEHMQKEIQLKVNQIRDAADRAEHYARLATKRANEAQKEAQRAQKVAKQATSLIQTLTKQTTLAQSQRS